MELSNATIIGNLITNNFSDAMGGGIYCYDSYPTIVSNTIVDNFADLGGGIGCQLSAPVIAGNIITANSSNEEGGGLWLADSSPTIINNTISKNSAHQGGGLYCGNVSNPVIRNTIFWGDSATYEPEIDFDDSSSPLFTYCDIEGGWSGEGNIDVDPLFRDPDNGDYHLQSITNPDCGGPGDSPCIDAGDPTIFDSMLDCDWGLGAERSDMGAYGGEGIPTNIEEKDMPAIPAEFILSQNYPNPFNTATTISYDLPQPGMVTLDIYDILGRKVQTLIQGEQPAGSHSIIWNADRFASGVYFYKLTAGEYKHTQKMMLLK